MFHVSHSDQITQDMAALLQAVIVSTLPIIKGQFCSVDRKSSKLATTWMFSWRRFDTLKILGTLMIKVVGWSAVCVSQCKRLGIVVQGTARRKLYQIFTNIDQNVFFRNYLLLEELRLEQLCSIIFTN